MRHSITANDLASAAEELRRARERYRLALSDGSLIEAIRARETELIAQVRLDRMRLLIEGAA